MARDKKTRITARVNGQERQILSIKERPNNDLIVVLPSLANFEHPSRGDTPLRERRWTFHNSPASQDSGETIVGHHVLTDGTRITTATYHRARISGHYVPVFVERFPSPGQGKFDVPTRSKDTVLSTGSYDPTYHSLVFSIVSANAESNTLPDIPGFQAMIVHFKSWKIHFLWTYMRVPSTTTVDTAVAATSVPREDGTPVLPLVNRIIKTGWDAPEVTKLVLKLTQIVVKRCQLRLIANGVTDPRYLARAGQFDQHPVKPR